MVTGGYYFPYTDRKKCFIVFHCVVLYNNKFTKHVTLLVLVKAKRETLFTNTEFTLTQELTQEVHNTIQQQRYLIKPPAMAAPPNL